MAEFSYELKVPKERVAVLIGASGKTKNELEELTNSSIDIDSKEGDVTVSGEDSLAIYTLRDVIKAIGRGFNPEIAKRLLKQDYCLEIIGLKEYAKNPSQIPRLKGRVIYER